MNGRLLIWAVALFTVCYLLNTRHNDFPWFYHPDEPGKVEQVVEGNWNLHHPLLLLGTTKVLAAATNAGTDEQTVVEIGRNLSAAFVSAAIVALSILAYAWRGWPAALLTGFLLATHHQLYELSHYLKEDSALLFGISLTLLAAWCYNHKPTAGRAALLGLACALATSGKYIGAMTLVLALSVLILRRAERSGMAWAAFAASLVLGLAAVNFPLFGEIQTFRDSFSREMKFVTEGQAGSTQSVPHSEYWTIFRDNTTPLIWVGLLIFLIARWRERRQLTVAEWLIIALPFAYTIALSFSPKTNDRYFLPATAVFTLLAGLAVADLPRKWAIPFAALLIAAQFPSWSKSRPGWLEYERAFQHDDTADMIEFLRKEVPANAVILKDNRIALPDPKRKKHAARLGVIPQKVIAERYAADFGKFEELPAKGITHVIISEQDYGRYFRKGLKPQKGSETKFAESRKFYERLRSEADLLWERKRGTVIYLHPGIEIYRLREPGKGA
jgi:hypothetical protein